MSRHDVNNARRAQRGTGGSETPGDPRRSRAIARIAVALLAVAMLPVSVLALPEVVAAQEDGGTSPHFFETDPSGLVANRRPANTSFLTLGDDPYRVEDSTGATAGFDLGFNSRPAADSMQSVDQMVDWPATAGDTPVVDAAVGFLTDLDSPDLVVLRGADGRHTPRGASPPPTTLTWHGQQASGFSQYVDIDLSGIDGTPVGIAIVNRDYDIVDTEAEFDDLRGGELVLATSTGIHVLSWTVECPGDPLAGCDPAFTSVASREVPPGARVLDVHHDAMVDRTALESLERPAIQGVPGGRYDLGTFGVLMSDPVTAQLGRTVSVDFLRLDAGSGETPVERDLQVRELPGDGAFEVTSGDLVTDAGPVASEPVGGDLRYRLGAVTQMDWFRPPVRVDVNVSVDANTAVQLSGYSAPVWQRDARSGTQLGPVPANTCAESTTGFDAVYFDTLNSPVATTSIAPATEATVVCTSPDDRQVRGYYREATANSDAPLVSAGGPQGNAVASEVSLSLPCAQQTRFQAGQVRPDPNQPPPTLYTPYDRLLREREVLEADDQGDSWLCSTAPKFEGFNGATGYPMTRMGSVQVTVLQNFAPTVNFATLDDATSAALTTLSISPTHSIRYLNPVVTAVPERTRLIDVPPVDVVEQIRLTGSTANCLKNLSPAEREACDPVARRGAPVPVAVMAAPPYSKGTGQSAQITPEFANGATAGQETTESTSTSVGAEIEVGLKAGVKAFGAGGSVEVTAAVGYERTAENSLAEALSVSKVDGYGGSLETDTVVVSNARYLEYEGVVERSTAGLHLCERDAPTDPCAPRTSTIRVPIGNVMTSRPVPDLLADPVESQWWGPGTVLGDALDETLDHVPGMPGSYAGAEGSPDGDVNGYCIGNLDPNQGFDEVRTTNPVPANPFTRTPALDRNSAQILTSEWYDARASSSVTTQRANIGFGQENSESFLKENTISTSVSVKAEFGTDSFSGSVQGTVSAAGSFGSSFTRSLGTDTEFSGSVGSLPSLDFAGEEFGWRMFVCKRELVPGVPVWVQGYQVRDYDGLYRSGPGQTPLSDLPAPEDLGELVATAPIESASAPVAPTLEWSQEEGTVADYSVELEAVGRPDAREFDAAVSFADYPTAAARPDANSFTLPAGDPLLTGQLYRWRVRAKNFFGVTEDSSWEYFVTEGAPQADLVIDDFGGYGVVGEPVMLRQAGTDGGLATATTWRIDGEEVSTSAGSDTFEWLPTEPGRYNVSVEVVNAAGSSEDNRMVLVAPKAAYDTYSTDEDTLLDEAAPGVLANDTGATSAELFRDTFVGDLDLRSDGSFTWMPPADACGGDAADSFLYKPSGGGVTSPVEALVALYADCVDDPPTAVLDSFALTEDTPLEVGAPGVLANDVDIDLQAGEGLTATVVDLPDGGTVALDADGSFEYVPDADFCGADSFTYRVLNGDVEGDTATVDLDVSCVDDPPVAAADTFEGHRNSTLAVDAPGVLANDTDADLGPGESLSAAVALDASDGDLTLNGDGSVRYEPAEDFCGTDRFEYRVDNGAVSGGTAAVDLVIACEDKPAPPPTPPPAPEPPVTNTQAPAGSECPTQAIRVTEQNKDGAAIAVWVCGMELIGTVWKGEPILMVMPRGLFSCPAPQRYWYTPQSEFFLYLLQAKCGYRPLVAQASFGPWFAWEPPR